MNDFFSYEKTPQKTPKTLFNDCSDSMYIYMYYIQLFY